MGFKYCGRRWGVTYCDEFTPCYQCKSKIKIKQKGVLNGK